MLSQKPGHSCGVSTDAEALLRTLTPVTSYPSDEPNNYQNYNNGSEQS
jgi:hypothetical protein